MVRRIMARRLLVGHGAGAHRRRPAGARSSNCSPVVAGSECIIPEEKKLDLLKTIAASSPYAAARDSRQLLP
ncbi:unnamed protein product [Urochloa humidicola]